MKIHALLPVFALVIFASVSCRKPDTNDSPAAATQPTGGAVEKAKLVSVTVKTGERPVMNLTVPAGTTVSYDGPGHPFYSPLPFFYPWQTNVRQIKKPDSPLFSGLTVYVMLHLFVCCLFSISYRSGATTANSVLVVYVCCPGRW